MSATATTQPQSHRPDTERPAMTAQSTARINPDTLPVLIAAIVVGLLIPAAASFTLSFDGLSAVAPWAAVRPERAWLIPVSIDAAQIGFTLAAFIHIARGESARWAWTWVTLWTLVSASANAAHAWSSGPGSWEGIAGAGLAAFFPIGTLITSHTAARIMIGRLSVVAASAEVEPVGTDVAPDPLVVLEAIEEAGPATTVATGIAGVRVAGGDGRRDVAPSPGLVAKVATPVAMPVAGDRVAVAGGDERCVVAVADRPIVTVPRRSSLSALDAERIATLARTTHLSGTKIAEELGTNKNRTCALVVQVRSELATTGALWAEPQAALA